MLFVAGRTVDDPATLFVLATVGITFGVMMIGVIAGLTQPVDPRVLATEPLTERQLGLGVLAASASGPPGLSAGLVGIGIFAGARARAWLDRPDLARGRCVPRHIAPGVAHRR